MSSPAQQFRHAPEKDLIDILIAHTNYRLGPGKGVRADLTDMDLRGIDFKGYRLDESILKNANLSDVDLTGVNLSDADISGADFRDASISVEQARSAKGWLLARWSPEVLDALRLPPNHNERVGTKSFRGYYLKEATLNGLDLSDAILAEATLDKAKLAGADLEFATLEEASLRGADLTNTRGLVAYQLRGTDLAEAKLPPEIADSLKTQPGVDEATKTSRKVFLTTLVACLYCWLTILSTTDAGLLIGNSTLALPIVQTPIPVVAFFGAAPVLLLIVYLYLHFSLQNLWDALATLPAVFPDGRPVHERTLPWILSPIVRLHFKRLGPCPRLARFQVRATALLVWWGVPFTLLAFWLRFLVRQDRLITTLQVIVFAISLWLSVMLWRITKDTLRGIAPVQPRWSETLRSREVFSGVLAGSLLALFSVGCFYGEPPRGTRWEWRSGAPKLMSLVGWSAFGDLSLADLSRKPVDWDGKNLDVVKGAQLQGRSLRFINAFRAFGPKANFAGADLRRASFDSADLRGAHFSEARLDSADFSFADLRSAMFSNASFSHDASFYEANLQSADFSEAEGVDALRVSDSRNWFLAHFEDHMLRELKICPAIPCDHEERLKRRDFSGIDLTKFGSFQDADFSGANLQRASLRNRVLSGADLSKADLRHADLYETRMDGVNLAGADLRDTDLRTVHGLTREQIESALTDEKKTLLPPYLEAQKPFTPKK